MAQKIDTVADRPIKAIVMDMDGTLLNEKNQSQSFQIPPDQKRTAF